MYSSSHCSQFHPVWFVFPLMGNKTTIYLFIPISIRTLLGEFSCSLQYKKVVNFGRARIKCCVMLHNRLKPSDKTIALCPSEEPSNLQLALSLPNSNMIQ